MLRYP